MVLNDPPWVPIAWRTVLWTCSACAIISGTAQRVKLDIAIQ
jgi:hypothetical protein